MPKYDVFIMGGRGKTRKIVSLSFTVLGSRHDLTKYGSVHYNIDLYYEHEVDRCRHALRRAQYYDHSTSFFSPSFLRSTLDYELETIFTSEFQSFATSFRGEFICHHRRKGEIRAFNYFRFANPSFPSDDLFILVNVPQPLLT